MRYKCLNFLILLLILVQERPILGQSATCNPGECAGPSNPGLASYEPFREGYLNSISSGGAVANARLPFRTETNRYADGKTSNVAFDVTSPSFPQYRGFLASPEGRDEINKAYMDSCRDQGIGTYGAGDAEKEAAKKALIDRYEEDEIDLETSPAPSMKFTVYAGIKWNPSRFCFQKDENYEIRVDGPLMWQDGGIRVGPEGYDSYYDFFSNCYVALGRCRSHLRKKKRIPSQPWMSLGCAVGQFVRPLGETNRNDPDEKVNYLPLDEAVLQETIFPVGRGVNITKTPYDGQLICFANDAHLNYWNNVGSLEVTVTRTSWPPSRDLYYEDLRLPACDSALMVYKAFKIEAGLLEPAYEMVDGEKVIKRYCNENGGGSGWLDEDRYSTGSRYGSSVDPSFYLKRVEEIDGEVRPSYDTSFLDTMSPYESMF